MAEYSGTISNMALYTQHLVDAFQSATVDSFTGTRVSDVEAPNFVPCFNIYNQISPLIITIDMLEPVAGSFNETKVRKMMLWDVWFDSSNLEFNITDDNLAMVQDAKIKFAWLTVQ
jgi:hypothetical protein